MVSFRLLAASVITAILVASAVYGFAFTALLIPAIAEFDVTLGRTSTASASDVAG